MFRSTFSCRLSPLAVFLVPALLAQAAPMPPPPLMLFAREEVKPGRGGAHAATESAWAKALAKGKATDHYLGMSSLTGPQEALFIMGYRSYADLESKQNEFEKNPALKQEVEALAQQDGDLLTGARTFLGSLRKELSYGPPVDIAKMRYFRTRTFRIKPGQTKAFEEGVKLAIEGYTKSHYAASFACYEIAAGMPSGSYVILRPMASLADLDGMEAAEKAFQEALGEPGAKAMRQVFADTVNGVENQLWSFNPKLSYPGPDTIAGDPAFWTVK